MTKTELAKALDNLRLPEYAGILEVFGTVLEARAASPTPDAPWLRMLAKRAVLLEQVNIVCSSYASLLPPGAAPLRAETEMIGPARKCPEELFQSCLGAFFAEMAAVTELARVGYDSFESREADSRAKVHDYDAMLREVPVCIEVEHMHAPRGVSDVFFEEFTLATTSEPDSYRFSLAIEYFSDDTVSPEQENRIKTYIASIRGRTAPFTDVLQFDDETSVKLTALPISNIAMRTRSRSFDDPETFSVERFLDKVRRVASRASAQMRNCTGEKVLVININSTWAEVDLSHLQMAQEVVRETNEHIRVYFLHH